MIRISLISRCAVIGALTVLPAFIAQAQDDPFGLLGETQTGEQGVVAPAQAADDPLAAEKSLLTAERPNDVKAEPKDFCRCVGETDSPAVAKIETALRRPLNSNGLDFTEIPLEEVVVVLQENYDIPVQIDTPSLQETGLDPAEPVTTSLHNISLRSGLRLMLKPLNLTYIIRDEVLLITTPAEEGQHLLTCVYDVRDLIDQRSSDFDSLIDTVVSCVATESWAENGGGEAEIRPLKSGLLVISQTQAIHEEIGGLLAAIREARDEQPAATDVGSAPAPDNDEVVTRSYAFKSNQAGDQEELRDQMRELIVQSMPDERWEGRLDDGQAVVLAVLPDRVVLRHRPSVHESVQAFLVESGIAAASSRTATREKEEEGGGGGGFFQIDRRR